MTMIYTLRNTIHIIHDTEGEIIKPLTSTLVAYVQQKL